MLIADTCSKKIKCVLEIQNEGIALNAEQPFKVEEWECIPFKWMSSVQCTNIVKIIHSVQDLNFKIEIEKEMTCIAVKSPNL